MGQYTPSDVLVRWSNCFEDLLPPHLSEVGLTRLFSRVWTSLSSYQTISPPYLWRLFSIVALQIRYKHFFPGEVGQHVIRTTFSSIITACCSFHLNLFELTHFLSFLKCLLRAVGQLHENMLIWCEKIKCKNREKASLIAASMSIFPAVFFTGVEDKKEVGGERRGGEWETSREEGEQMNWWPFALFYRTTAWPGLFSASQKTPVSCWRLMLIRACRQSSL